VRGLFKPRFALALVALAAAAVIALVPLVTSIRGNQPTAANAAPAHASINCAVKKICADVAESDDVFGHYVGHDEPSNLFYSNVPGSGNRMAYALTLPKDPPGDHPVAGQSFNFQNHIAFWFGMAMCDTQSYPEQVHFCTPDSDKNIVDPKVSPKHPGEAFMEMQFYPPGWVEWPSGTSCDAKQWCAALNIDSLSRDPVAGQQLNPTCVAKIGSVEYVNFAFITKNGKPQPNSPPNPVDATLNTFTPNRQADLFMNSGDTVIVAFHDTQHGLQVVINDLTTHQSGSMTASAANGFGQVKYAPTGTTCQNIPYDFHPMYSTSSPQTRVTWAAHSYNIAFSDEIGHWDYCTGATPVPAVPLTGTNCPKGDMEGAPGDKEPTDVDDTGCFPASMSSDVRLSGCLGTNAGFDGTSYLKDWPDGNPLHPQPVVFTSPLTGANYNINYSRTAFEADLPVIESTCNITTGKGCTLIPTTDDGKPATFYPFYTSGEVTNDTCVWTFGSDIPGVTEQDFGKNNQYGALQPLAYTSKGGGFHILLTDFHKTLPFNGCPARPGN
jgi:hypothetical protein